MKTTRRTSAASRRPIPLKKLVPNVRIVTNPKNLALLKAEAARLKRLESPVGRSSTNAVGPSHLAD